MYIARSQWFCSSIPASGRRDNLSSCLARHALANLPDSHNSRWGNELTAEKMKKCVWLLREAVAQIEFFGVEGNRVLFAQRLD